MSELSLDTAMHVGATDYIPEFAILAGTFTLLYKHLMQAVYRVVTNKQITHLKEVYHNNKM
jgi:hypothetical protein